ncbi:MAG: ASCH domain-containing protein [Pirellulales bacterium]
MLLFKKKFLDAIRDGTKTQTIRVWRTLRYRAGQRSYIPGVGYIRIESIEPVEVDQLTDADALPDGFASAATLRAELAAIYADPACAGGQAYRLRFRVLPTDEQAAAIAARVARKTRP